MWKTWSTELNQLWEMLKSPNNIRFLTSRDNYMTKLNKTRKKSDLIRSISEGSYNCEYEWENSRDWFRASGKIITTTTTFANQGRWRLLYNSREIQRVDEGQQQSEASWTCVWRRRKASRKIEGFFSVVSFFHSLNLNELLHSYFFSAFFRGHFLWECCVGGWFDFLQFKG